MASAEARAPSSGADHARVRVAPARGDHDVGRRSFLRTLDAEPGVTPRTVNKHRQLLCSVFKHAMRDDTFKLPTNPAAATDKRREPDTHPIDFYEPEEVLALARAARSGAHRDPSRPAVSAAEAVERARADEQDAALFIVAAFSGLRMGELLALQWRHADFAAAVLAQLGERDRFSGRDDLVFVSPVGGYLDPSALRRRFRRAQKAAGLRPLRFHDLRHSFGSLVIREFDPVSVKDFMGHAKITTTERYLHARLRRTDAARMTKAFAAEQIPPEAISAPA